VGRFALGNAVAVAALLMGFPASAEEVKLSRYPELLTPSPDNKTLQAAKMAEYACMEVLNKSAMGEATGLVAKVMTAGRGETAKFLVDGVAEIAAKKLCDAMVKEPAKPGLNSGTPPDFSVYRQTTGSKTLAQAWCSLNESNSRVCAGLAATPPCAPGQSSTSGQCIDMPSMAAPK
jgi:hypothetical protein